MVRGGIDACGSGSPTPPRSYVHISVTLCRFDDNMALASNSGPFIPCERRLAISGNLRIQGRGLWTGFFEIGSMPGLMATFRRHSGFMTNFSIFRAESRRYWPQYGCGSQVCGGGQTGLRSAWGHGSTRIWDGLGPGNTNPGCWEGSTRYSTLPVPTRCTTPPPHPAGPHPTHGSHVMAGTVRVPAGHAHMTVFGVPKEILGVDNAQYMHGGTVTSCRTVNTPALAQQAACCQGSSLTCSWTS